MGASPVVVLIWVRHLSWSVWGGLSIVKFPHDDGGGIPSQWLFACQNLNGPKIRSRYSKTKTINSFHDTWSAAATLLMKICCYLLYHHKSSVLYWFLLFYCVTSTRLEYFFDTLCCVFVHFRTLLNEIRQLKAEHEEAVKNAQQMGCDPNLLTELRVLRQRKDELEMRMSALQETRRELMVQLEGLMKLLKVRSVFRIIILCLFPIF